MINSGTAKAVPLSVSVEKYAEYLGHNRFRPELFGKKSYDTARRFLMQNRRAVFFAELEQMKKQGMILVFIKMA